jgi:acyl-CoA hydrolase
MNQKKMRMMKTMKFRISDIVLAIDVQNVDYFIEADSEEQAIAKFMAESDGDETDTKVLDFIANVRRDLFSEETVQRIKVRKVK